MYYSVRIMWHVKRIGMHASSLSLVAIEFSFISVSAASLSQVYIINVNMVPFFTFSSVFTHIGSAVSNTFKMKCSVCLQYGN